MNILLKMTTRVLGVHTIWYDCRRSGYVNYVKDYFVTFSLLGVARVRYGYALGTYVAVGMMFIILGWRVWSGTSCHALGTHIQFSYKYKGSRIKIEVRQFINRTIEGCIAGHFQIIESLGFSHHVGRF